MTMKMYQRRLSCLAAALLMGLTMVSCGGGGGGVGSGGTGEAMSYSEGTITGFASVIVDGTEYFDDDVRSMVERQPGTLEPVDAQLGQFAQLEFEDDKGRLEARAIRLDAAVVGPVASVSATSFEVMGQTVHSNNDADLGPVTVFAGVSGLSGLEPGDPVEVHGVPRWNSAAGRFDVQATRIERLASAPASLRVAGVVSELRTIGELSFELGGLRVNAAQARRLPGGKSPSEGDRVVVWATQLPVNGRLTATAVRTLVIEVEEGGSARIGGSVTDLDEDEKRFRLGGLTVRYDNAKVTPADVELFEGAYLRAEGVYSRDGSLNATQLHINRKPTGDEPRGVLLKGEITDFTGVDSFKVRRTEVDASGVRRLEECGLRSLGNGLEVEIEGELRDGGRGRGSVVWATRIECTD
ncbi:DUF5666 domain-containing protein [Caldimonas brevitalea]|uniref:DUF5666 domain-containing protein n=1 Tax=Caldimonas brevitalea TaxID=413882 RepID=A0A0G3BPY0_9BURK|nr:DUF5666 domain-containing protein [Caldimonas brevitalea]AKJ28620.1 hypothetical protein AAW51_1929 [Caldimonas brevitalea]